MQPEKRRHRPGRTGIAARRSLDTADKAQNGSQVTRAPGAQLGARDDRYVRRYVARFFGHTRHCHLHGLQRRDFFGARHRGGDGQQRRKAAFQARRQPPGPADVGQWS